MKHLVTPIINLNGNTSKSLLDQLKVVMLKTDDVVTAMRHASDCWHGRNFQSHPAPSSAQREAQIAWMERMEWLNQFHEDVLTMALEIQAQGRE